MKKIILLSVALMAGSSLFPQGGIKFDTQGNILAPTDFMGSQNPESLKFRVNNVQKMSLDVNGVLQLNGFSGTNSRLVETDATGKLIFLPQGLSTQYLAGNNTYVNFPPIPPALWVQNGTTISYTGTVNINGDISISNNVYVGGQVLIGQRIKATTEVITPLLKADTLRPMVLALAPASTVMGDIFALNKLSVAGSASFLGNAKVAGTLDASSVTFKSGQAGIGFFPASSGGGGTIVFGSGGVSGPPNPKDDPNPSSCLVPPSTWIAQFNDQIRIKSTYLNSNTMLSMGYDGTNHYIEGAGTNASYFGKPLTLINYYCGNDVAICTGTSVNNGTLGGFVFTGANMQIGGVSQGRNVTTALNIGSNGAVTTAINVEANGSNVFKVASNGRTKIGTQKPKVGQHDNSMLSVYGDITTTAIYVTDPAAKWADFVFKKTYKLMPWQELEKHIIEKEHLPGVPTTKQIQQDGNNLAETDAILLQKIEEDALYIIDLHKKSEAQDKKIEAQDKKLASYDKKFESYEEENAAFKKQLAEQKKEIESLKKK